MSWIWVDFCHESVSLKVEKWLLNVLVKLWRLSGLTIGQITFYNWAFNLFWDRRLGCGVAILWHTKKLLGSLLEGKRLRVGC